MTASLCEIDPDHILYSSSSENFMAIFSFCVGFSSFFMCLYLLLEYRTFKEETKLVFLVVSELCLSFNYVFQGISLVINKKPCPNPFCVFQLVINSYFGICSSLWIVSMAHSMKSNIQRLFVSAGMKYLTNPKGTVYYHILCWGLPILLIIFILSTTSYITDGTSCYLTGQVYLVKSIIAHLLPLGIIQSYLLYLCWYLAYIVKLIQSGAGEYSIHRFSRFVMVFTLSNCTIFLHRLVIVVCQDQNITNDAAVDLQFITECISMASIPTRVFAACYLLVPHRRVGAVRAVWFGWSTMTSAVGGMCGGGGGGRLGGACKCCKCLENLHIAAAHFTHLSGHRFSPALDCSNDSSGGESMSSLGESGGSANALLKPHKMTGHSAIPVSGPPHSGEVQAVSLSAASKSAYISLTPRGTGTGTAKGFLGQSPSPVFVSDKSSSDFSEYDVSQSSATDEEKQEAASEDDIFNQAVTAVEPIDFSRIP